MGLDALKRVGCRQSSTRSFSFQSGNLVGCRLKFRSQPPGPSSRHHRLDDTLPHHPWTTIRGQRSSKRSASRQEMIRADTKLLVPQNIISVNMCLCGESHKILWIQNFLKPSGFNTSATGKLPFPRPLSRSIPGQKSKSPGFIQEILICALAGNRTSISALGVRCSIH